MNCKRGQGCPFLNGRDVFKLLAENNALKHKMGEMEHLMELASAKIENLEKESQQLKKEKEGLLIEVRKKFKPNIKKENISCKKGAPFGHTGRGRKKPKHIDEYIEVHPTRCPKCGSEDITVYPNTFDERIVEDIEVRIKTTCYRTHHGYCKECKKSFYPKDAIPSGRVGPLAQAVSGYLHYIGVPYRKAANIFNDIFGLKITHPPLIGFDNKFGENGELLYEMIKKLIRHSDWVNADETGWRISGQNGWLWVFPSNDAVLYKIDKSRSSKVVEDILGDGYGGILGSDFYSSYNSIKAKAKQRCITHLLREIEKIEEQNNFAHETVNWKFCEGLKETFKDAIGDWNEFKEGKKGLEDLKAEKEKVVNRLAGLLSLAIENKDTERIRQRIIKHNNELLTFLEHPEIEPTNNRAERYLRPSVIMRKLMFGNRSDDGAHNHSVIMSIIQTGILNNIRPLDIFVGLLRNSDILLSRLPRPP